MTTTIPLSVEAPSFSQLKYELTPYPRQVRIESAFSCPMACTFCHSWGNFKTPERKRHLISLDLVRHILEDIASWERPLIELCPTNFGEITAHPKWYEIMKMVEDYLPQTYMALPTTGINFTEEDNLEKLASLRTLKWLNFSINAFFEESWERIHRRPKRLMLKILELPEKFRAMRPDVVINISLVYDPLITTVIETELFEKYWREKGFQVGINTASYANNPKRKPEVPVTLSCRSVFDGLVVFAEGSVGTGCCFDSDAELVIGKVPEEKLLNIWKGEKLEMLAMLHNLGRRAELSLCRGCSFA